MPAIYCEDYFAEEIAAEIFGNSNSAFNYTKAYTGGGSYGVSKTICPNLQEITSDELNVKVVACEDAKKDDPNFEPDVECIDLS